MGGHRGRRRVRRGRGEPEGVALDRDLVGRRRGDRGLESERHRVRGTWLQRGAVAVGRLEGSLGATERVIADLDVRQVDVTGVGDHVGVGDERVGARADVLLARRLGHRDRAAVGGHRRRRRGGRTAHPRDRVAGEDGGVRRRFCDRGRAGDRGTAADGNRADADRHIVGLVARRAAVIDDLAVRDRDVPGVVDLVRVGDERVGARADVRLARRLGQLDARLARLQVALDVVEQGGRDRRRRAGVEDEAVEALAAALIELQRGQVDAALDEVRDVDRAVRGGGDPVLDRRPRDLDLLAVDRRADLVGSAALSDVETVGARGDRVGIDARLVARLLGIDVVGPLVGVDGADTAALAEGRHDQHVASLMGAGEGDRTAAAGAADAVVLQQPDADVVAAVVDVLLHPEDEEPVGFPAAGTVIPGRVEDGGIAVGNVDLAVDVVVLVALPAGDRQAVLGAGRKRRVVGRDEDAVGIGLEVALEVGIDEAVDERLLAAVVVEDAVGPGPVVLPGLLAGQGARGVDLLGRLADEVVVDERQVARLDVALELEALVVDGEGRAGEIDTERGRTQQRQDQALGAGESFPPHRIPSMLVVQTDID